MDTFDRLCSLTKLNNSIYRCTQAYLDKYLVKYNLSIGTYPYLFVLHRLPGISQNEISKELNVDKSISARTIKKLIDLGYVNKVENKADIRAYKLYLTEQAEQIIPEIKHILHDWIHIIVPDEMAANQEFIENGLTFLEQILENGKKHRQKHCERTKGDE